MTEQRVRGRSTSRMNRAQPVQILDLMGMVRRRSHQDVVMITGEEDFIHADFHDRH